MRAAMRLFFCALFLAGRKAACWYNEDSVCDLRGYSKLVTRYLIFPWF